MSDPRTLGPWLRRFLTEYIVTERNLARNTQKSYRDTFALLLPFVGARARKPCPIPTNSAEQTRMPVVVFTTW